MDVHDRVFRRIFNAVYFFVFEFFFLKPFFRLSEHRQKRITFLGEKCFHDGKQACEVTDMGNAAGDESGKSAQENRGSTSRFSGDGYGK
jgi:hypothetical protein